MPLPDDKPRAPDKITPRAIPDLPPIDTVLPTKSFKTSREKTPQATESGRRGRPTIIVPPSKPQRSFVTKCIYFKDADQVKELVGIAAAHPQASVSSIMQQLAEMFLHAYATKGTDSNVVEVPSTKIFL